METTDTVVLTQTMIDDGVIDHTALLAPLIARIVMRAVEQGRWRLLPDGELVPAAVDTEQEFVVQ